ncbi:cytochrome c [uncultured Desulfobacter sp.]|uniref:c-type cytochrome n=1 Tax=uncultured Desulfobacter sp. TaxID=240139 RepID=UPI0029F5AB03|nr:cytochrome c [uncultured Desulfobacter sp.]
MRGPYLIPGYMSANQVHMVKNLASAKDGRLSSHSWINQPLLTAPSARQGQALFDANCAVCHTIGGINDITRRLSDRTLEGVNAIISITDKMVPFMPPFPVRIQNGSSLSNICIICSLTAIIFVAMIFARQSLQDSALMPMRTISQTTLIFRAHDLDAYRTEALAQYQTKLDTVYDNGQTIYDNSCLSIDIGKLIMNLAPAPGLDSTIIFPL